MSTTPRPTPRLLAPAGTLAGTLVLVLALASPADPATFGVPTNLDAAGLRTAASANPPGYLTIQGPNAFTTRGDTVHQTRLFIEVTGTTLDIRIFDPGNAASLLDETYGGVDGQTVYTLFGPGGGAIATVTIGADNAATNTDNRLVRFRDGGFCLLTAPPPCAPFTGLTPGRYTLRIRETTGDDTNVLGVDIRDATGSPYSAYVIPSSDDNIGFPGATESAMLAGVMAGAPISGPMTLYPLVDRGCSVQTSNFDSDGSASASLRDTLGVASGLTLSGNGDHDENTVTVESTGPTSIEVDNYGTFALLSDPGANANLVDWRLADWRGWAGPNDPDLPRNANSALRIYLPNDATGAAAPPQPTLQAYARVEAGANPPVTGSSTTFLLSGVFLNPTAQEVSNVQITLGELPNGTVFSAPEGLVNGSPSACTLVSGARYRRCTFATVPAFGVATFRVLVTLTPGNATSLALTEIHNNLDDDSVWAQYTSAFNTTETRGPLCPLTVAVGAANPPLAVTRATIRGVRVDVRAGIVEFATGRQRDTVSFMVYGTDDATRRGARVPLTAAPVLAPVRDSQAPVFYRVATGPIQSRYLIIEETDGRGRRRAAGPFAVDDAVLRAAFDHLQARFGSQASRGDGEGRALARASEVVASSPARQRAVRGSRRLRGDAPASRPAGLKLLTRGAGWAEVPLADLEAAGLPRRGLGRLALTSQGRPVPFEIVTSAGGEVLRFKAERLRTDYTHENAYVVTWRGAAPALRVPLSRSGDPLAPGHVRVEKDRYYSVDIPLGGDPFVWEVLTTLDGAWPYDFDPEAGDFDLPGLEPGDGDVPVRLSVRGVTMHRHVVDATLNGVGLGRIEVDGRAAVTLESAVPGSALRAAGNHLEMRYAIAGAPAAERGMLYLEHLDLGVALGEDGPVAWELSEFRPHVPSLRRADYLILTHDRFAAAAQRLADVKASEGLQTLVVDVERAYDRYAGGVVEARAIAALLREAARPALRGVVLVGDDSVDPLDHTGMGASSFVPSLVAWDGELGRVPSENLYADVDGDGRPDLAIGRLPAADEEEAEALVAKVARQQSVLREQRGRFLMAADNQGPEDAPFQLEAQDAAARLPGGSSIAWADLARGAEAARADLLRGWADGASVTQYFGHAGEYVWADERLLAVEDVGAFAEATRESVVLAWTCEAQAFNGVFGPTVNEALVVAPRGGALAAFGPAGISDPALQRDLRLRVNELFVRRRLPLGEAVRRAKAEALAANPRMQPVVDGFNLLGDPLLRLE